VGLNAPTLEAAKALQARRLSDLRLLAELNSVTDFILNSTPHPETIDIKTWMAQPGRRGRDILPLQRFSDLPHAILGEPGRSLEENLQRGTVSVRARRRRVPLPAGRGRDEAERITIVGYDTSGSMSGEPAEFQAALIGSFTAKALSDVSPSGRYRHRVILV